jgi:Activator of Hsp90 ATPase homolog 1-like protein
MACSSRIVTASLFFAAHRRPARKLFRAWTEPEVLKQWLTPAPYTTPVAELDVRPGGANLIVMRDPEATSSPTEGSIWRPSKTSAWFFTGACRRLSRTNVKPGLERSYGPRE